MRTTLGLQTLGRSGLRVSELALGTMTFGPDWGWGADLDESRAIFRRYAEAGGNFVDTASNYTDGTSERYVGELVAGDRDRFVLATKYTLSLDRDDPNAGGNHRKSLVRALEQSLRRLDTDYVDLLWLHMRDGRRRSTRPCARSTTRCGSARSSTSGSPTLPRGSSRRRTRSPTCEAGRRSSRCRSPTAPPAVTRSASSARWPRRLGWRSCRGASSVRESSPGSLRRIAAGRRTGSPSAPSERRGTTRGGSSECVHAGAGRDRVGSSATLAADGRPAGRGDTRGADDRESGTGEHQLEPSEIEAIDEAGKPTLGFPRDFLESADVRELIYGDTYDRIRRPEASLVRG